MELELGLPELPGTHKPARCSHMNMSPCTLDAGGDAPQLTLKETRSDARYAGNPAGAFDDTKPHTPGRDPVRARGGYGLP